MGTILGGTPGRENSYEGLEGKKNSGVRSNCESNMGGGEFDNSVVYGGGEGNRIPSNVKGLPKCTHRRGVEENMERGEWLNSYMGGKGLLAKGLLRATQEWKKEKLEKRA